MLSKKKKIVVLTGMFLLLIATAVVNFIIASADGGEPQAQETGSFFTMYRTERTTNFNAQMLIFDTILATTEPGLEQHRITATEEQLALRRRMELEADLEVLITGHGFADVVVNAGPGSDRITVMYKAEEITAQDAAIIYTIVYELTELPPDKVNITPIA